MNSWYIDRSKNFIYDTLLESLNVFYSVSKGKSELDVNVLVNSISSHPELNIADGNINAALTRFRDHGFLRKNNTLGDSAIDYIEGRISESELVVDLFLKRPASKSNSVNVKPFVLLCKVFDIMIDMLPDVDDIFITSYECKEYLLNINDMSEITYEYIEKMINERDYSLNSALPIPKVEFDQNEDTNFSIWFNALNTTPIFIKKEDSRSVLRPNIKQREFFKYISENSDEFSMTPTDSKKNLYNYYCDRKTGINEILPDVINDNDIDIDEKDVKSIFEYLFGYKRDFNVNYNKYFKNEYFGVFFPFITLPGLVIRKIYYKNKKLAEFLYEYISNKSIYEKYLKDLDDNLFEFYSIKNNKESSKVRGTELMKEKFEKWLIIAGLASSTVKNYVSSISITSREAIEDGLIKKSIYNIVEPEELTAIMDALFKNEKFLFRKINYNGINNAAINNYLKFLENVSMENEKKYVEYNKEKFLNDVFIDESKYDTIVSILKKKRNIILEGAPGVGKTFMAKKLAYSILEREDEKNVKIIQFHQNYSYEEFIEGYRPSEEGFKLEKGLFYKLCKEAELNPSEPYYLIIDEINRGNLSKVFGELLMLIEWDKRGEKLLLAYSGDLFSVPKNLYIIGLMNTADRSLALIDYALRRRFSFIRIEPAFDNPLFIKKFSEKFDQDFSNVLLIIKEINEAIEKDNSLGSGFKIGHSYFCPDIEDGKGNKRDIQDIITYEIIPLLEEYWYDDPDSIIQWKNALNEALDDKC